MKNIHYYTNNANLLEQVFTPAGPPHPLPPPHLHPPFVETNMALEHNVTVEVDEIHPPLPPHPPPHSPPPPPGHPPPPQPPRPGTALIQFWLMPWPGQLMCMVLGFPLAILFFMDQLIVTNTVDNLQNK